MAEQRPPDDGDPPRVILTNAEWWKRERPDPDNQLAIRAIYVEVTGDIVGDIVGDDAGRVRLAYRRGDPSGEAGLVQTYKSLDMARRILTNRGFRRVDQL